MAKEYIEKDVAMAAFEHECNAFVPPYDNYANGYRHAVKTFNLLPTANVREDNPVAVRCRNDCYWIRDDFGDFYTPPSSECGKDFSVFEDLNIEPCYGEHDDVDCPVCPFYLNYEQIKQMEAEYHIGEPVTHGDELRAMNNDQLAEWLKSHIDCKSCPVNDCKWYEDGFTPCSSILREWLRENAEQ